MFGDKVGSDTITINVGAGIGTSGSGDKSEEQTVSKAVLDIDKDTEITRVQIGMFNMGDASDGEPPEGGTSDGERPEMPEGDFPDGKPPEKPEGGWPDKKDQKDGEKPEDMPDFDGETIKLSDISEGDMVTVTLDENGKTVTIKVMGGTDDLHSQGERPEMPDKPEGGSTSDNSSSDSMAITNMESIKPGF